MSTKSAELIEDCLHHIRDIPDFPKQGIIFKDITPLLKNGPLLRQVVDHIADFYEQEGIQPDLLACPEARGFIFGAALAYRLGIGLIPIRKPAKLPYKTTKVEYDLEYGTDAVEMHVDAISAGQKVLLVDDLLATGGTIAACADLLESAGSHIVGCFFLIELDFLEGRKKLQKYATNALLHF